MATNTNADDPTVEPLTSSAKVEQKVEWIISTGRIPDIEDGYESDRAGRMLSDYATHPNSDDLVVKRAENAIEALAGENEEAER